MCTAGRQHSPHNSVFKLRFCRTDIISSRHYSHINEALRGKIGRHVKAKKVASSIQKVSQNSAKDGTLVRRLLLLQATNVQFPPTRPHYSPLVLAVGHVNANASCGAANFLAVGETAPTFPCQSSVQNRPVTSLDVAYTCSLTGSTRRQQYLVLLPTAYFK